MALHEVDSKPQSRDFTFLDYILAEVLSYSIHIVYNSIIYCKLLIQVYLLYSRLSISRTPRDCLKYIEIPVLRHIRFPELRKKSDHQMYQIHMSFDSFTLGIYIKTIVEKGRNCS